jgi:hypothetical protein
MVSEPATELLRCSYTVFGNCRTDLQATNLIGVARLPEPHVLDP